MLQAFMSGARCLRGITKTCLYGVHFVDLNKMVTFCHRFAVKAGFIHGNDPF